MSIVFILQFIGGWANLRVFDLYKGVRVGATMGGYHLVVFDFFLCCVKLFQKSVI